MKTKTLHQKIEEILWEGITINAVPVNNDIIEITEMFNKRLVEFWIMQLEKLFDEVVKEVVGEPELSKNLPSKNGPKIGQMLARNLLRSEILKKWKKMNEG